MTALKANRLPRTIEWVASGAVLGLIIISWVVSLWWPAKVLSVNSYKPARDVDVIVVETEVSNQMWIAWAGGPIVGGVGGLVAAIAVRRAGGRV